MLVMLESFIGHECQTLA